MIRLRREDLSRADVAALERMARWLGLPEPRGWRTERVQREHGGGSGPRRRIE